ncbi:UNVERIFIED_CONTAM: hypothetical protein Slati_0832200 [Sesamum latifolium]|uniref:Uncharacterized protein n=1 Tax=Sesamum latifolium TaxID=2727402 RepID=A0AAW2XLR1_9LAMI
MDLDQNGFDLSKPSIHSNVVRKLPLPKCGLTSRGTLGIEESCTIVVNDEAWQRFLSHESWGQRWSCHSVDGPGLTLSNMIRLESSDHVRRRGKISWESHRMRMVRRTSHKDLHYVNRKSGA